MKRQDLFCDNIYTGKININGAERDQSNLLEKMVEFNNRSRPKTEECKKTNTFESTVYEG